MSWWRHSRLAQIVAMVLLLWTAADLTNSSLCALENEDGGLPTSSRPSDLVIDAQNSTQIPTEAPAPHIDDCFCCSHCVEVHSLHADATSSPIVRDLRPLVLAAPRLFGTQLYHPPLA